MHTPGPNQWPTVPFGALGKGSGTNWVYVEKQKGVFDWSTLDAYVKAAQDHGVSIFYSNDDTPPWATTDPRSCRDYGYKVSCTAPPHMQDWHDFTTALVTRYKDKLIYELWNEPDTIYFTGTVADMVAMSTDYYNNIRSLCPQCIILAPSGGSPYMDKFFAAGGPTGVDAITIHSYFCNPEDVLADVDNMKAAMAKYGLSSKPLWDTEGSWGTCSLSADQQVAFVGRYHLLNWSDGVSRFYWYMWLNSSWGYMDSGTPAAVAYTQVYNWLVGAKMMQACAASGTTWTCGLVLASGSEALAIWDTAGSKSYTPAAQYVEYRDLSGNTVKTSGPITIGTKPVLLEMAPRSPSPASPTNLRVTVK